MQKKLLPLFHYSLLPKGLLFLGLSEAVAGYNNLFSILAKNSKIFERKNVPSSFTLLNHHSQSQYNLLDMEELSKQNMSKDSAILASIKNFILNLYISPTVIVDHKGDVIYVHGKLPKDVFSTPKTKISNLIDAVHLTIRKPLASALRKARSLKKEITIEPVISHTKKRISFLIKVTPIKGFTELVDYCAVSVNDTTSALKASKLKATKSHSQRILELENELNNTKTNLQTVIEELETSNEELQSTNEELQSTNEEIETSKEELQSLNEELVIVNTELQNRIDQLAVINDDMNNLFTSTEIAAFFLDNDLRIKRFTPKARDFVHLIQTDIGRSLSHFANNLKNCNIVQHAEKVLQTLNQIELEVEDKNDDWFIVRILPYRTLTNMIDGVVITFNKITTQKLTEKKLRDLNVHLTDANNYVQNIFNTVRESLIILDNEFVIKKINKAAKKLFPHPAKALIGMKVMTALESFHQNLDIARIQHLLTDVLIKNKSFENYEIKVEKKHISLFLNARRIVQNENISPLILLAIDSNEK